MSIWDFFKSKINTTTNTSKPCNNDIAGPIEATGTGRHNGYWAGLKDRKPKLAEAIEKVCGKDLCTVSDSEAYQIVASFSRWSANANIPVEELKEYFIGKMESMLDAGVTYEMLFNKFKTEKPKEAKTFNILEDYTISNFMYEWLLEMRRESESDLQVEQMAGRLHVTAAAAFKDNLRKEEDELNLTPDISKFDREENKLFDLVKKGFK